MRQCVVKSIEGSATKWVDVAPARLPGWIDSFARRHGETAGGYGDSVRRQGETAAASLLTVTFDGQNVIFTAPDGAVAECHPPFPPVPGLPADGAPPDAVAPAAGACAAAIAAHALAPRTTGVLLVRLGGYAAGVFTGSPPVLADSKTGARLVHGRSAAGGWSQHRFARRREKQAAEALQAAAAAAVAVFGRWGAGEIGGASRDRSGYKDTGLDAVVLGGDKRAVAELRADPRLLSYLELAADRFLTVPDPKLAVLKDTPRLFLAVRIRLTEPTA
jgi:Actinobacteria/chloroflexi VLRF1 release factor